MAEVARDDNKLAGLDNAMKSKVNKLTSSITERCLPNGLVCYINFSIVNMTVQFYFKMSKLNFVYVSVHIYIYIGSQVPRQ